ncbi:DMT family transporter [Sunxiuqinia sp. A32]|uniref:DMT family transporter n=1 Tax=Sunxiuqinia sp. A32 TaxID=3461496 RepID=UPI00404524F3
MKNQKTAILLALASVLLWSTVASAFKMALRGLNPWQLIFIASLVTLGIFTGLMLVQGKLNQLFTVSKKDLVQYALLGLLNPFAYYLVLFKAYELNPAQVAQALNMVWPISLALLSVPLLGQKITKRNIYAVLISFIGVVFIASQGSIEGFTKTNPLGAFLALVSSIIWALYWILSVKSHREKIIVLFWNFVFGTLYLLVFGFFNYQDNFDFQFDVSFWTAVYVGVFELGITYLVWMKALEKSENNAVTGNFIFLTPFLSLIFIYLILKEQIYWTTFAGLSLILLGIFIQQLKKRDEKS